MDINQVMEQKLLFIESHLEIVVKAVHEQPAVVYYFLFDDQREDFRQELIRFLIQCDVVTQPIYDLDFYYLMMEVFHGLVYYIQECYLDNVMSKEEYDAALQQIRKYCKMVREPNVKVFRLSRMMERKLLEKNR